MYPTKERILNHLPKIRKETIEYVKQWKKNCWENKDDKNKSEWRKFEKIRHLLWTLSDIYKKPISLITITKKESSYYIPLHKAIFLKNPQSIISALHEFSHHVYGASELQACRWSIAIFKEVFPKSYSQLTWKGHMLIKEKND